MKSPSGKPIGFSAFMLVKVKCMHCGERRAPPGVPSECDECIEIGYRKPGFQKAIEAQMAASYERAKKIGTLYDRVAAGDLSMEAAEKQIEQL